MTPNRIHRTVYAGDDHRIARLLWVGVRESVRVLLAGPGIAAAWALYGLWWRSASSWGPMRWKPVAVVGAAAVPMILVIVAAVAWMHSDVPLLGWYIAAQLLLAVARLAWLIRAYGWDAVTATAQLGRGTQLAPIRINRRTPEPTTRTAIRRTSAPAPTPPIPISIRTEGSEE